MSAITCKLNGKKYLLIEVLLSSNAEIKKFGTITEKHDCIYQGVSEYKSAGSFSSGSVIYKVLVPEENIIEFNKEKIS